MIYFVILILHLCFAIFVIGFCFSFVFIYPALKQLKNHELANKAALKRAVKLIPLSSLFLALSGFLLLSLKPNDTALMQLKIALACTVFAGIAYWSFAHFKGFKPRLCFLRFFRYYSLCTNLIIASLALACSYFY